jgi:hypothetical protein
LLGLYPGPILQCAIGAENCSAKPAKKQKKFGYGCPFSMDWLDAGRFFGIGMN